MERLFSHKHKIILCKYYKCGYQKYNLWNKPFFAYIHIYSVESIAYENGASICLIWVTNLVLKSVWTTQMTSRTVLLVSTKKGTKQSCIWNRRNIKYLHNLTIKTFRGSRSRSQVAELSEKQPHHFRCTCCVMEDSGKHLLYLELRCFSFAFIINFVFLSKRKFLFHQPNNNIFRQGIHFENLLIFIIAEQLSQTFFHANMRH